MSAELQKTHVELLSLLRAGDVNAFTQIYELNSQPLYFNLLKLIKFKPAAEELLQDIFVALWEKRASITIETHLSGYLFGIAQHKVQDFFRKVKRDKKLHDYIWSAATGETETGEKKVLRDEELDILSRAIENLSPQRKLVFKLCKLEGRSYQEVSAILGISSSTINDHIVKATRSVKEFILANEELTTAYLLAILMWMPE